MNHTAAALAARLADLLRREHGCMADFLVALADFDRRRGWVERGHASLFGFLHRELGLSKASAFYRMTAARLLQRFPELEPPLRDGRLCLSSVGELSKVITEENRAEVLPRFFHCSRLEARAVAAAIAPDPAPPRRDVVTHLAARSAAPSSEMAEAANPSISLEPVRPGEPHPGVGSSDAGSSATALYPQPAAPAEPTPPIQPPPRDLIDPLTSDLRRLHVTLSARVLAKLDAARDALTSTGPVPSTDAVIEAALDLLLEKKARQRAHGAVPRRPDPAPEVEYAGAPDTASTTAPPPPGSPRAPVPAHVKRAVWKRDGGCCQWPLASGGICGSRRRVQLDHRDPHALGGKPTVANVRLLCRFHNDLAAREAFGERWMDRYTRRAGPAAADV